MPAIQVQYFGKIGEAENPGHAQEKLHVLATDKKRIIPAGLEHASPSEKRRAMTDGPSQAPALIDDGLVVSRGYIVVESHSRLADDPPPATEYIGSAESLVFPQLARESVRHGDVVRIHAKDEVRCGRFQAPVQDTRQPEPPIAHYADSRVVEISGYAAAAVGGSVVIDYELEVPIGLLQYAPYRLFKVPFSVMHGK